MSEGKEMPTKKEQFEDIASRLDAVETALGLQFKPESAMSRLWGWIKANKVSLISVTALILTVAGWFVGTWFKYHLDHKDDSFNAAIDKRIVDKLSPTTVTVSELRERMARVEGKLDVLILRAAANLPTDYQNAKLAKEVLIAAKTRGDRIDLSVIADAGAKFVDVANASSQSWDTALAFLNYRSFLTSLDRTSPIPTDAKRIEPTKYEIPDANIIEGPVLWDFGSSHAPDAPQLRTLGAPNLNEKVKLGPAFVVLDGGAMVLDGLYLKRVVFRNTHILYRGGALAMDNVYFVNCTFDVIQKSQGQNFARAILSPNPSISLKAG
jgi:hypothetical protein